ncbi:MAG: MmgE/PrpD family protein [Burkholderiales bacterium]
MKSESLPARSTARELTDFVRALSIESVPGTVTDAAKWCLLDTLGCALFGVPERWSQIMAEEMLAEASKGQSSIVGHHETVAAPAAALCNGTAAHGFELDDHLDEAIVHPGAIIVSAALAAAEGVDAAGARLLLGIIAGYETLDRVGLAMGVEPSRRGWHKTAVAGPVGAAVAAAVVLNLSADQISTAVGLACATASGTKAFATGEGGGMEKRMHAGRAAEAGVRMAQLAARGFTAPPTAVDGRFGLLEVISGQSARADLLAANLGTHWAVEHVYVKVYPCCAWIQAAVQQLVALRGPRPLNPQEVRKVRIGVSSYAGQQNGSVTPRDTMGAQFSIPYCAALALAGDPADPAMFAPDAIDDSARREIAKRVEIVVDPEMEAAYPRHYGARVDLELANGERRGSKVLDPHGMPADPCTERERLDKFSRLASRVKSAQSITEIVRRVQSAEQLRSAREIGEMLRE